MSILRVFIVTISCLFSTGCAYVSSKPYEPHLYTNGIRIPEQVPLLVVSGANTSIIYANNPNRGSALRFGSFLAKHKLEAEFSNGSLSKITSDQDTTEIGLKLIELVQEAAKSGNPIGSAFSGKSGDAGGSGDRYGIFAFKFDEDGNFTGLYPVVTPHGLISVPINTGVTINPAPASGGGGAVIVN